MTRDELHQTIDQIVAEAEQRGYERGYKAAWDAMQRTVAAAMGGDGAPSSAQAEPDKPESPSPEVKRRTPKGVTESVLREVLATGSSMSLDDLARAAQAIDPRISKATVYNELYRKGAFEKDVRGLWYLVPESGHELM